MTVRRGRTAKTRRRDTARTREERQKAERGDMQRQRDSELLNARIAVLDATREILDHVGHELNVPPHLITGQQT